MRGLQIYEVNRGGKDGLKLGLILEGDENQVYKFETSIDTAFARGMLWGVSQMNEQDIATGQIGINPTTPNLAKATSDNAGTILYCNMFVNGVELPYPPSEPDTDWQKIAHKALCIANRCEYPIAQVPQSRFFQDQKEARKTQQPGYSTGQNVRSQATAPIQPQNVPRGLQATPNSTVEPSYQSQSTFQQTSNAVASVQKQIAQERKSEAELGKAYSQIMLSLDQAYLVNEKKIDGDRMQKVLVQVGATKFDELSVHVKNQVVCTLAKELIESKYPKHSVASRLAGLAKKGVNNEVFNAVTQALSDAFSPSQVIQPDLEIPF
jgi:hypothetical protein